MLENSFEFNFEKQIFDVFKHQKLIGLSDLEEYFKIQAEMIEKYREKYLSNNDELEAEEIEKQNDNLMLLLSEIKNCNSDLKLFTANLFIFHPNINNPTNEIANILDEKITTYNQNFSDWIYSANVSCCYEKLYNFWDRIGDVLALYLKIEIKEFQIGFYNVIEKIDQTKRYSTDEDFIFLKNFAKNEFKEFNSKRKKIVHYYQFETEYEYEIIYRSNDNEVKIKDLWDWKNGMPEYFKNHLKLSINGYLHCFKFISKHF
ncbi:hypothetical protein [Flavobacterium sp.]|jgi:hypothetical protein|uniref:hypothetical protein n=1 Tax=Flavobacterium sp. TaxID=239 RepID=UPI0037BF613F